MTATRVRTQTFPVIELFGPTVQGEGPEAGRPAYFIRFGGCDFRCSWCDSLYAVDPAEVRANATQMSSAEIRTALGELTAGPTLVVLTGGNPALHPLDELVEALQGEGFDVAVETQGSVFRPWLVRVDRLVVSPKPPSSGEASGRHWDQLGQFMASSLEARAALALKVVVFDQGDLAYATEVARAWPAVPLHLSVGTDPEPALSAEADRARILDHFRWLCEAAAQVPELSGARVLPQLHVLAWGRARGV
jgi:7-carboxy-7-deazaguanine synthase